MRRTLNSPKTGHASQSTGPFEPQGHSSPSPYRPDLAKGILQQASQQVAQRRTFPNPLRQGGTHETPRHPLHDCANANGKTGTCEPNPGSTKAIEKTAPSESFDKINEDIVDPQGLGPDPQEQFPIDLEVDENVHVTCVGKDTDGYGDAALVFTVTNNTGVDMMFGDVDSYAYVNGVVRDVRMRQPVAAGEETRAMLTFVGTFDDPDFDVNNDLNDIYLNIWMFEEATGNVYFRDLVHIP